MNPPSNTPLPDADDTILEEVDQEEAMTYDPNSTPPTGPMEPLTEEQMEHHHEVNTNMPDPATGGGSF